MPNLDKCSSLLFAAVCRSAVAVRAPRRSFWRATRIVPMSIAACLLVGGSPHSVVADANEGGAAPTSVQLSGGSTQGGAATRNNQARITVGSSHVCVVWTASTVQCWGANNAGQLGDGTVTNAPAPTPPLALSGVTGLTAGFQHSCALQTTGTVQCWGANNNGQLGNGTFVSSTNPVTVAGTATLSGVRAVSSTNASTCALLSDATAQCWGNNVYGQLGSGAITLSEPSPVTVNGLSGATAISVASQSACALLSDATVACWGSNSSGQLGTGTVTLSELAPVAVVGVSGATAITSAGLYSCALLSDGTVRCWGDNSTGQLGNGTTSGSSTSVLVSGLANATSVSAANTFACAALSGGAVRCWGDNTYGQLGNGTTTNSSTPVTVSGLTNATAVSVGQYQACATLSDGSVQCWGRNNNGQLGNGTTIDSSTPVSVTGLIPQAAPGDNITINRPPGGLVFTQRCGVHGALPFEPDTFGAFGALGALPASTNQVGTAPTTPNITSAGDSQFAQYPYPVDSNGSPSAVYPTHCGIDLGISKLVTTGSSAGGYFAATGFMNQVTVVDTRDSDPGWAVNGVVSDFVTTGGALFSGNYLGWTPVLTSDSGITLEGYDQSVTVTGMVPPNYGAGLKTATAMASAAPTKGLGMAVLDARLRLLIPVTAVNGVYRATMTITVL